MSGGPSTSRSRSSLARLEAGELDAESESRTNVTRDGCRPNAAGASSPRSSRMSLCSWSTRGTVYDQCEIGDSRVVELALDRLDRVESDLGDSCTQFVRADREQERVGSSGAFRIAVRSSLTCLACEVAKDRVDVRSESRVRASPEKRSSRSSSSRLGSRRTRPRGQGPRFTDRPFSVNRSTRMSSQG